MSKGSIAEVIIGLKCIEMCHFIKIWLTHEQQSQVSNKVLFSSDHVSKWNHSIRSNYIITYDYLNTEGFLWKGHQLTPNIFQVFLVNKVICPWFFTYLCEDALDFYWSCFVLNVWPIHSRFKSYTLLLFFLFFQ